MDAIASLQRFGLSEKEAKTYLACLELGETGAGDISIKNGLPRTLVYDILERLIDLGLASYSIKNNKKYFKTAEPKELLRILKEKELAIEEALPNLEALNKKQGVKRPRVETYEGIEGMKTVLNKSLNSNAKEFTVLGASRLGTFAMPGFMEEWHRERIKKKIFMRIIFDNKKEIKENVLKNINLLKYSEYRFMPINLESAGGTLIYGNKVILRSWTKEPFSIVIESEEMANNQRKYFEELWKIAKKH